MKNVTPELLLTQFNNLHASLNIDSPIGSISILKIPNLTFSECVIVKEICASDAKAIQYSKHEKLDKLCLLKLKCFAKEDIKFVDETRFNNSILDYTTSPYMKQVEKAISPYVLRDKTIL